MAIVVDMNEVAGCFTLMSKADLTTLLGYITTRLTALGKTPASSAQSGAVAVSLAQMQTYINNAKNVSQLQQMEAVIQQQIAKLPV
jgi:hypothetical protein